MRVPSRDVNMASELRRFGDQPTNSPSGGFSFLSLFSQPLMIYSAQEERREGEINLNYLRDLRRFIHSRSFSLLFFLHCHSLSLCLCLRNSLLSGERTKFQRAKSEREGYIRVDRIGLSKTQQRLKRDTHTPRKGIYVLCTRSTPMEQPF